MAVYWEFLGMEKIRSIKNSGRTNYQMQIGPVKPAEQWIPSSPATGWWWRPPSAAVIAEPAAPETATSAPK